mmetsp:Transcript_31743/g.51365  ORF Transcript_31743/g.51365 Transcript_31743/m.51365 type:complete len:211 (-) Transcript_31743:698-1330(-)
MPPTMPPKPCPNPLKMALSKPCENEDQSNCSSSSSSAFIWSLFESRCANTASDALIHANVNPCNSSAGKTYQGLSSMPCRPKHPYQLSLSIYANKPTQIMPKSPIRRNACSTAKKAGNSLQIVTTNVIPINSVDAPISCNRRNKNVLITPNAAPRIKIEKMSCNLNAVICCINRHNLRQKLILFCKLFSFAFILIVIVLRFGRRIKSDDL